MDSTYSIAAQVERLDKIAEALSLSSFHVAGNSMGGNISGKYAARFPEKVLSLGLFNSGGVATCPERSELSRLLEEGENPLLTETPEDFEAMINFAFVKPPWFPGPVKKALAKEWNQSKPFNEKVFRELFVRESFLEPDLPKMQTRTLILWGDTDRLVHVSCTEVLEKGLQNSTTVIMKDCGHVPMMERPEETSRHYIRFLQAGS
jgi:pimeloyl-ACP methyl ester carboxylesterase